MKFCALCRVELGEENYTREHIISQAIGGRLKVAGFICQGCNSLAGNSWDAELARQLNWFSVALNIKRESGTPPPSHPVRTVGGEDLLLHPNGSLAPAKARFVSRNTDDGKHEISITARTMDEARKILNGVQRKHPNNNYQEILENLQISSHPLEDAIHIELSVGGPLAGKSIVKTAIAMASYMSIPMENCVPALRYLTDPGASAVWAAFHLRDLILNRPSTQLFHAVAVSGDPTSGSLLGYVEYYGAFRHVVVLSQEYRGPKDNQCYAIDPVTGSELQLKVNLSLSEAELARVVSNDASPIDARIADLKLVLPMVLAAQNANGRTQLLNAAITETFNECGVKPGEEIPSERFQEFSAKLAEKAAALLIKRRGRTP